MLHHHINNLAVSYACYSFSLLRRYTILFLIFLTCTIRCSGQAAGFSPIPDDDGFLTSLYTSSEKSYKAEVATLNGENRKELEDIYEKRWKSISEVFNKKEIYSSTAAKQYLDALRDEIVKNNPALKQERFNAFFSRSGNPNASYIGEGIILFNMGLFKKLENESQAAFILCHEMAHMYLRHSEKGMQRYVNALYSTDVQKELRQIKNNTYGKREQVEELVKGLSFNLRRHSRDHESQADSMGLEFMRNTKFDIHEALTSLALLDSVDNDTLNINATLQQIFSAAAYPFKKKWIAKQEGLLGGHAILKNISDSATSDSLKTHPDCKVRIKILAPSVIKYKGVLQVTNPVNVVTFNALQNIFKYEIVEYTFSINNYSRSLYYALELLNKSPAEPYLITHIGKILNGIYSAQKTHTASKLIDLPAPFYPPNYNQLLQFIQNLYPDDVALINYNFLLKHQLALQNNSAFSAVLNTSKQISTL